MLDLACIPDSLEATVVVDVSAVSRYMPTVAKHSLAEKKLVQVLHVKWCSKYFMNVHCQQLKSAVRARAGVLSTDGEMALYPINDAVEVPSLF